MMGQIILWLFVIVLGIELGAGLYETLVVVPLWAANAPDSVIAWYQHNAAEPQLAVTPGPRFWMVNTPLLGLLSLAALLTGFRTIPEHRKWRMVGSGLALLLVIATFAWFVPNIIRLGSSEVLTMNRDELAALANAWVSWNWVRVAAGSLAWLFALRAFSVPARL